MKIKGEFKFPDISIRCWYDSLPEVYCDIDEIIHDEVWISNETWKWRIESEEIKFRRHPPMYPIKGIRYNSKVSQSEIMSNGDLDNRLFDEMGKVMKDFLGMRDLVFYDNGNIRHVENDGLIRDYELKIYIDRKKFMVMGNLSKEEQIEDKQINAIYRFKHPIKFDCEYSEENYIMKCELLSDEKGYVPIYEDEEEKLRNPWGHVVEFDISDIDKENEKTRVITGFQFKSRTGGGNILLEFDHLIQFIFVKKLLIDSEIATAITLEEGEEQRRKWERW